MDETATAKANARIYVLPQNILQGFDSPFDRNKIMLPVATKGETPPRI
jgi:hypothetical protein